MVLDKKEHNTQEKAKHKQTSSTTHAKRKPWKCSYVCFNSTFLHI